MKSIYVACKCHKCGYQTHKQSETFIISDFEPHLMQELKTGTFFYTQCPACESMISFFHPCLCIVKEHKVVVYIKPKQEQKEEDHNIVHTKNYRKRYVSKIEDLVELFQILEDDMDERVIQILKVKLMHKEKQIQKIQYKDYDKQSQTLWFHVMYKTHSSTIALYKTYYNQIKQSLPSLQTEYFEEIHVAWAQQYISS